MGGTSFKIQQPQGGKNNQSQKNNNQSSYDLQKWKNLENM